MSTNNCHLSLFLKHILGLTLIVKMDESFYCANNHATVVTLAIKPLLEALSDAKKALCSSLFVVSDESGQ